MRRHLKNLAAALAALVLPALLALAGPAAAQESYRAPTQKPMPMLILPKPERQAAPEQAAPEQTAPEQAAPAAKAAPAQAEPVTHGKFPNKDTAKNRQDYEMGTDTPGTTLGRDEQSGDTVLSHTPPKKASRGAADTPITVVPVIRGGR
jgi:hypothetical protein